MASDKSVMAVIRAARPLFRNNNDKVAFAVHASFLASGYVLTATGPLALSDTALTSTATDEVGIDHWNELDNEYAFVYANPEKGSKKVLVKCLVINDKLIVDALANGEPEPVHLEINVGDTVGENGGSNYSTQYKNLDKLVNSLDSEILSKLNGSQKAGSSSNPTCSETNEQSRTVIIDSDEPSDTQRHSPGIVYPPVNPGGFSDLLPGPGAGMYPPRSDFGPGSMLLGPNDPRWSQGIGVPDSFGGLPGVPHGARYDPIGPPGVPGFEPNRFVRNPRRPGRGTHPDVQHFGSDDFI
ncbi:hypothetical protein FNV43_RR22068 [Rhamnella rubrinervis]|uniref:PI31 proteasome regulator N-terminal domain-containing protein n=1 Tax=Rhamnella rubrinervis TaxID=2594499 RepID=A0A8K0GRQ8_9ROSA|nr:hypothetical protein FNV43_RR22068 [Rhamnella rubrinervis]